MRIVQGDAYYGVTESKKTLGVMITAFNEPRFIKPVIEQFAPIVKVVVAVSNKPWYGDEKADDTFKLAFETNADMVLVDDWKDEAEQRNQCMEALQDCDYVLVCHTDTFFTHDDIHKLIDFIQTATGRQYNIQTKMYWKDLDTIVQPDPVLPAMLIRSDVKFSHSIIIEDQAAEAPTVPDVICHHLSWAKTDDEIKTKISTYTHANEIVPNWFEDVWLKDKETDYKSKVKYSCPDEIRRYFETA